MAAAELFATMEIILASGTMMLPSGIPVEQTRYKLSSGSDSDIMFDKVLYTLINNNVCLFCFRDASLNHVLGGKNNGSLRKTGISPKVVEVDHSINIVCYK